MCCALFVVRCVLCGVWYACVCVCFLSFGVRCRLLRGVCCSLVCVYCVCVWDVVCLIVVCCVVCVGACVCLLVFVYW